MPPHPLPSLQEDLQTPKTSLTDFVRVAKRILDYIPSIVSRTANAGNYQILSSVIAGNEKFARPINGSLFIDDAGTLDAQFLNFLALIERIAHRHRISDAECHTIDSVIYTIQQAIGVGMDFLCNQNSARKHVGNRFEELIRLVICQLGVTNTKMVFKIPYPSENGRKLYSCETDLVVSPHASIQSSTTTIDTNEIVISLKTTSKDRMGKIFLDKLLMEEFANHPVKVIGVFLNDVQRKESAGISYTFVSGLFMVYTQFLTELDGVYFIDPPPITQKTPYNRHIAPFSKLLSEDIWTLLAP